VVEIEIGSAVDIPVVLDEIPETISVPTVASVELWDVGVIELIVIVDDDSISLTS
jgi:hypothetical protein